MVTGNIPHSRESTAPSRESLRSHRLPALTTLELGLAFAQALDLAEGKEIGHTYRLTYIAVSLARQLGMPAETTAAVFHGALNHDLGAVQATADLCRHTRLSEESLIGALPTKSPEELGIELSLADMGAVVQALHEHTQLGAETARLLGHQDDVVRIIECHHERWDGLGFPAGLAGSEIPPAARIVTAADVMESIISSEKSGLSARRNLVAELAAHAGNALDPEVVMVARELARSDEFWLGLYDERLPQTLARLCPGPDEKRDRRRIVKYAEVFADMADIKRGIAAVHSRQAAEWAERLAIAMGYSKGRAELVRLGALLRDVGLLGVPAYILAKPDILSVTEMLIMRRHPGYSQMVVDALPGLEEVAAWAGRHHERPDGKGYPEMLGEGEIPEEASIIAVADVFVALTTERPYRSALSVDDAKAVLLGATGSQLDAAIVDAFISLL